MKYVLSAALLLCLLYACTKDKGLLPSQPIIPAGTSDPCATNISYSVDIAPVVTAECAKSGCHITPGGGSYDFASYSSLKNYLDIATKPAEFKNRLSTGNMPMGGPPFDQCKLKKFQTWVDEGYQNN